MPSPTSKLSRCYLALGKTTKNVINLYQLLKRSLESCLNVQLSYIGKCEGKLSKLKSCKKEGGLSKTSSSARACLYLKWFDVGKDWGVIFTKQPVLPLPFAFLAYHTCSKHYAWYRVIFNEWVKVKSYLLLLLVEILYMKCLEMTPILKS